MRASFLAAAMMLVATMALGHESMGHWGHHGMSQYLYGIRTDTNTDDKVNCCLFNTGEEGHRGDCKRYPDADVKFVAGGYLLADGEYIPHSRTNVSPQDPVTGEYYFYRCRHDKNAGYGADPKTHCFFAPPSGS
jgi:hypothetical protein